MNDNYGSIEGSFCVSQEVYQDTRGTFREWYRDSVFTGDAVKFEIAQANCSVSKIGTVRGIHYSLCPEGQSKWITCVVGKITDVLVDLRVGSPTFLSVSRRDLNSTEGLSLYVPSGVGHGFISLQENSVVIYLTDSKYNPEFEYGINPFDPEFAIDWGSLDVITSDKDRNEVNFKTRLANGELPVYKEIERLI